MKQTNKFENIKLSNKSLISHGKYQENNMKSNNNWICTFKWKPNTIKNL